jgi:hypothetical protein
MESLNNAMFASNKIVYQTKFQQDQQRRCSEKLRIIGETVRTDDLYCRIEVSRHIDWRMQTIQAHPRAPGILATIEFTYQMLTTKNKLKVSLFSYGQVSAKYQPWRCYIL